MRQTLSLADVLVWDHFFGLTHAAEFVAVVDPGFYPARTKKPNSAQRDSFNKHSIKQSMQISRCIFTALKPFSSLVVSDLDWFAPWANLR